MISLKKIIVEGRYDSLVTELSRKMLTIIKDSYAAVTAPDGKFAGESIYYKSEKEAPAITSDDCPHIFFEEVENSTIPLEFYLILKVQWIAGLADFRYGGDAYNETKTYSDDMPLIEVRFELDPADYPTILSNVAMQLRDVLRHEIEHLTQSGWNTNPIKYIKSDQALRNKIESGKLPAARYFTLPKETPAMLQGMYLKAKKSKTPFSKVINDYLDLWVSNNTITDIDKQQIIDTWRTYLPKLGIRQEL